MASFKLPSLRTTTCPVAHSHEYLVIFCSTADIPRVLILLMKEMLMSLNYSLKQSKVSTLAVGRLQPKSSINGLCFIYT